MIMITKTPLILMALLGVGRQQKSEIDKCVDAKVVQFSVNSKTRTFPEDALKR